jgi:hypothetical protein
VQRDSILVVDEDKDKSSVYQKYKVVLMEGHFVMASSHNEKWIIDNTRALDDP